MRGARILVGCLLLAGLFWSCMDDRTTGNTTQTENTAAARTFWVDSILPCWNRPYATTTVATLKLDATNFDFDASDPWGRDLSVEKLDGAPLPFEIDTWDKVARRGRLYVRIEPEFLRFGSRFVLRWKQPLQVRSNADSVWKSVPDSQKLAIQSVLVADFENGPIVTDLPTRPVWETYSKDTAFASTLRTVPAGGGRTGNALLLDSATWAKGTIVFKTPLVKGRLPRSLRSMDSIVYWVKGTRKASYFVAFDHFTAFKSWKLDTLDTVWTRVRYTPDELTPASDTNGGNRGWEAVRDSVTDLTFIPNNGGTFMMLDDIRIYGVDRDDFR
jgi:hypothetical protein